LMRTLTTVLLLSALSTAIIYYNLNTESKSTPNLTKANKCPFGYQSEEKRKLASINYLSDVMTCSSSPVLTTLSTFTKTDYENVVASVVKLYEAVDSVVTGTKNNRARFAGCTLRLAGHDFMDFRKFSTTDSMGGADGCINFNDGDNNGLLDCITNFGLANAYG